MTDGQWLFTIFATLYLLECVRWLPGAAYVLCGAQSRWQVRRPWVQVQIARVRLLLLPVLPPIRIHLITLPWLFVPCEDGVEACDAEGPGTTLIPWNELAPRVDGTLLLLTDQVRIRLPNEAAAKAWEERLLTWVHMKRATRENDFLRLARQSLDTKALAAEAAKLSEKTAWPRSLASLIFVWTFGVITAVYRWLGEGIEVMSALAVLIVLLWAQAIVFFRVAGRGPSPLKHRFWKALAIAFMPQHAMRAADPLCREQTRIAHPLAARSLLSDAAWRQMATHFWNEAKHGRARSAALQAQALETFFRLQGVTPEELEPLPARQTGSAAYCPHCQAQFVDANLVCGDCGGLALKTWPENEAAAAVATS